MIVFQYSSLTFVSKADEWKLSLYFWSALITSIYHYPLVLQMVQFNRKYFTSDMNSRREFNQDFDSTLTAMSLF